MKNKVVKLFFLFIVSGTFAQYSNTISSGRPGQAVSPSTVGKKVIQVQAGVDYYEKPQLYVPNSFFRYGISDRFELNSGVAYSFNESFGKGVLSNFTLGTRINLYNENDKIPSMGLQASFNVPVNNIEFGSSVLFIISDSFSDNFAWTINLGSNIDTNFRTEGVYVLNFYYSINDKIGIFVEPYGTVFNNKFTNSIDAGISYLLHKDLQLDALFGKELFDEGTYMIGAGVSWRLKFE